MHSKHAGEPEHIAQVAVNAALGKKTPKSRYVVGNDANILIILNNILPEKLMDKLFYSLLKT
jgi:hypothetical protein